TELISIQKQYGISIPAIMYRLVSLGIFDNSKIKSFYIKQNQDNEFKRLVNESRYYGNEKSSRFNSLVYKALSQEIISISKASSLLNTDIESLRNNLTLI
ncbi:MAG: hypothetical protein JXL97_10625, partial [Bacteroidales bacterium]|nr:hypothetical protein [Bacteroidales bacterium]